MAREPLKVGLAGLGAVGLDVARRLEAGIPGLVLAAVAVRDRDKARRNLPRRRRAHPDRRRRSSWRRPATSWSNACRRRCFAASRLPSIDAGQDVHAAQRRPASGPLGPRRRAKQTGARILVPTGALIGLDAVRAAAEGTIHSVTMVTRKPPSGLEARLIWSSAAFRSKISNAPAKIFDGSAREGARGFPANVNVAAALSLAGIGPDKTRLEIWADPALSRNTHRIEVDADTARFSMSIEGIPSENPRTGRIVPLSVIAALRGLVAESRSGPRIFRLKA